MKIVAISDTHNLHHKITVPDGDILIHSGDFTNRGTMPEILGFNKWLMSLPHKHKIVIAGNHDFMFEREPALAESLLDKSIHYLRNDEIIIEGVKFYGSPVTPWFFNWAFNVPRGEEIAEVWAKIPDDTHVLVTHGPPAGILDEVKGGRAGCEDLLERIKSLKYLEAHVFGHLHENSGMKTIDSIKFVNASQLNDKHEPKGNICEFYLH